MGTGKNNSFDKNPNWNRWAILIIQNNQLVKSSIELMTGNFINKWLKWFTKENFHVLLEPISTHGKWDNKHPFHTTMRKSETEVEGAVGILTRATIRLSKLSSFWKHVPAVSNEMQQAKGRLFSIGIGEIPYLKQATFSIWESEEAMKAFAYNSPHHKEVIQKTRKENWYSEEMFTRFKIVSHGGTIDNLDPLAGKL